MTGRHDLFVAPGGDDAASGARAAPLASVKTRTSTHGGRRINAEPTRTVRMPPAA